MLQDDYLMRLIRRAADAVARAFGLLAAGDEQAAEIEAATALKSLARLPLDTITMLDTATLRPMIAGGDPAAVRLAARASYVLGEVAQRSARPELARQHLLRAMRLYAAVGVETDDDRATASALAAHFSAPS